MLDRYQVGWVAGWMQPVLLYGLCVRHHHTLLRTLQERGHASMESLRALTDVSTMGSGRTSLCCDCERDLTTIALLCPRCRSAHGGELARDGGMHPILRYEHADIASDSICLCTVRIMKPLYTAVLTRGQGCTIRGFWLQVRLGIVVCSDSCLPLDILPLARRMIAKARAVSEHERSSSGLPTSHMSHTRRRVIERRSPRHPRASSQATSSLNRIRKALSKLTPRQGRRAQ